MENYFSNLFNSSSPTTAPSAPYTITPATSTSGGTSSPSTSGGTSSPSTSGGTSSPSSTPEKCEDGSTPRVVSTSTTSTTTTPGSSPGATVPFQGSSDSEFTDFVNDIFNATTYTILFWIVAMYAIYRIGQAVFANRGATNETSGVSSYSRTIDIAILAIIGIYFFQLYYNLTDDQKNNILGYSIEWTQQYLDNPWSLFEIIWFTIIFFALVYILRVPMEPGVKPVLVNFVEHKIWILYATFAVIYFFKYVLGVPIITLLFNNSIVKYFENVPPFSSSSPGMTLEDDLDGSPSASSTTTTTTTTNGGIVSSPSQVTCEPEKQVFNVSNNLYNYEEAQKVCAAFDASLATYNQVEAAYNNGGEWCNYGWSDGQMAYFPTQKDTWEKLQKNPNTKHACGRPGINGGFINNPYVRFGANCYGIKAPEPDGWSPSSYDEDCAEDTGESEKMQQLRNMAKINSFNVKKWSRY